MYFRRYWHWQSYASYAAVWLFCLTFVSVQQQRFYGDGCSAATLNAKQQQNTQIFQKHSSARQLQTSGNCSEQMARIGGTILPPLQKIKSTTTRTRAATIMTATRQVVGDVVTEAIPTLGPMLRDKTAEMPHAMPAERDSESVERLVTAHNNEVAITKASAHINGLALLECTNSQLALKAASGDGNTKDNTTESFNSNTATTTATTTTTATATKICVMAKIAAMAREVTAIPKFQISSAPQALPIATTNASPITPLPFAAADSSTTASQVAKQFTAKNLKHAKHALNADDLVYDFKANVANLFANDSAAVRTGNARNAVEFKNSKRHNELPSKNVHENSDININNNDNDNNNMSIANSKQPVNSRNKTSKTVANNKHNEHKTSVDKRNTAGLSANAAANALSANISADLLAEPAAVVSSVDSSNKNDSNQSKNDIHNQLNEAPHSNERRHIVPEKLQYTKEIRMKQGRLMGITRHFQPLTGLRDVDQYLGLPYAEAPVGSRRFMPPGAPLPWQGLKMARHLPAVCVQQLPDVTTQGSVKMSRGRYKQLTRLLPYLKTESEDCLYLNVYVPRVDGVYDASSAYDMNTQSTKRLPVMVYVHGESFAWNSGNPYDGSVLASYGQVIVVTINYRLGVMGFLKPSIDENTVANFGLLDQIAALHWIKENIASFGGDKDSVTLMGHSTGAACVNYLMISPVASGLFHRAILMSGSAMSDWAVSNHSLQLTMQIAHTLNCPLNDDNEEMLSCLRQKRYQDILKVPTAFPQFSTPLGPIVDGHVIPNQPYKVMGQYTEHFSRYDLLFGVTESESYHTLGALALEAGLRENERDNLLRFYMQTRFDVRPDLALAATLKKYEDMYNNPTKGTNSEHRDVVLDILSDARVVGPLMQTGLFHADVNRRNYMYVFGHNSATGPHANLPHSITGEELAFIFGAPIAPAGPFPSNSYGAQEKLLSEAVMTYWTNFAKTGNPKAPWKGSFINLHALEWDRYDLDWPEFNKRTQSYMNIGIPPSIGYKYRQVYMNFWNKELPDELNQIANIQRQPYLHTTLYNGADGVFGTSSATAGMQHTYPVQRHGGGEVITGHMSQFGTRDNVAEDPVRTLKLLLQEPWKLGGNKEGADAAATGDTFAENMYNAPPTFGVTRQTNDEQIVVGGLAGINGGSGVAGINHLGGFNEIGVGTGATLAGGTAIYGVPRAEIAEYDKAIGGGGSDGNAGSGNTGNDAGSSTVVGDEASTGNKEEVAKSETTIQLLIGLIAVFIVLNVIIYSTFLLQRKKKSHSMQRKLGGILSYDGTTDDEFKRSKQNDGDESYILDIVRKSNTYEAVKTERSPINGFQMARQLSTSTVDTHTKVCAWMSAAVGAAAEAKACVGGGGADSSKGSVSKKSSSPTFSSLRSSSAGGSFKQPMAAQKVSVAVDATPSARNSSVLEQEPIELHKLKSDGRNIIICQEVEVTDQNLLTPQNSLDSSRYALTRQHSAATEPCEAELPQQGQLPPYMPMPQHAHSHSDPVDMQHYYSSMCDTIEENEKVTSFLGDDVNVTSRDEENDAGMASVCRTPAQQLQAIKSRNYPKVLPTNNANIEFHANPNDSPPMTLDLRTTNKRNSLPPNSFLPHFSSTLGAGGTMGTRYPPLPPPRTISTLGRKPSARRNSSNITTSPLMLAHDCTAEEEYEPPITQNTLIVGPIVPQQKPKTQTGAGGDTNYSTLKRAELTATAKSPFNSLTSSRAEEATGTAATKLMHSFSEASLTPANAQIGSKSNGTLSGGAVGVTTFLSNGAAAGLQSFESRPISVEVEDKLQRKHQQTDGKNTHHTERIYAIQQPTKLPATQNDDVTAAGMANALAPRLITPAVRNLAGQQNGGGHNNIMTTTTANSNNNNGVAIARNITDIYAQPNKSTTKAKLNSAATDKNMPCEQTETATTRSTHNTSHPMGAIAALTHPHDNISKSIALDNKAKANSQTTATAATTKITSGLGATELTNIGADKPVTATSMQTMESLTAAAVQKAPITTNAISATVSKAGVATAVHACMPQIPTGVVCSDSIQARLEQKQTEQRQHSVPTAALTKHGIVGAIAKTAAAALRTPVNCTSAAPTKTTTTPTKTATATRTIADAIAAQLAQTKPLKAALACGAGKTSTVGAGVSRQASLRESRQSSVSARSTDSSASTDSTVSSNASTATGTSSSSTSSSTGTVRTELQQK